MYKTYQDEEAIEDFNRSMYIYPLNFESHHNC